MNVFTTPTNLPKGVSIFFSGKKLGNTDHRYGEPETTLDAQKSLFQQAQLDISDVSIIDAKGGSTFQDLEKMAKPRPRTIKTDALITTKPNSGLALFPADCIPLVVYSAKPRCLALVHVGWRGAVGGLHKKTLDYMQSEHGVMPDKCFYYLGPSIKQSSYHFPSLHPDQMTSQVWQKNIIKKNGEFYIDLPGFVKDELIRMGAKRQNIDVSPLDTADENNDFFSNYVLRKTGESQGRNGVIVALSS